ncbi:MAG: cbb3-type cytochrome oxidase assembly protein CcoS [Proteobacteria bacterium]|nr:cbb3-type cytochrome oxidase assembly protein CcoS [Pseudomonadota bacterium]
MFYLGWIALTAVGILLSIAVFLWALKSGQFSDQKRARYLPLRDQFPLPRSENPSRTTSEMYALVFIILIGFAAMATTVVLTVVNSGG